MQIDFLTDKITLVRALYNTKRDESLYRAEQIEL
jgi:hypothetical protein